ncbi:MAG: ABC transporter substrate-binding protein [Burkholderiales bacterium]
MNLAAKTRLLAASVGAAAAVISVTASAPAFAQAKEQFFPMLVYRTGPYAPNGVPFADGYGDYLKLLNARDGGINGVKIAIEECETGYATDRGVECYERLKNKGSTGATVFQPLSTGITFALTPKAPRDKVPLITAGYGRADSVDGSVFTWNFPLGGTYWDAADILVQHVGKKEGGMDKLKGKKIALVYHDSPYGKEPIPLLEKRAKMLGFDLLLLPVTHPGVEQSATWLQIRQQRPDYVFLWGWGVMNSTAIKQAVATGYPMNRMYGVWWSGAEPDVLPAGEDAKAYNALVFLAPAGRTKVHQDILKYLYDKGQGTASSKDEVGQVLYNRGMVSAMMAVEGVKRAQQKYGKKPLTGEQVRWGLEHLSITEADIKKLGFEDFMEPIRTSCADHEGAHAARIQTWDGKAWHVTSGVYQSDMSVIEPIIKASAAKYAAENKITPRDCSKVK